MSEKLSYYEWIVNDVMPDDLFSFRDFDSQKFLVERNSFLKDYILDQTELENELEMTIKTREDISNWLGSITSPNAEQQDEYKQKKRQLENLDKRIKWLTELKPYFGKSYSQFLTSLCQQFNINIKIILATLQKEQSLVVKPTQPPRKIMDRALGFGATDRGDLIYYYGFEIQNYKAIQDFKSDFDKYSQLDTQPMKFVDNGFLQITPANAFTSVLYEYTPWTGSPDSAYYPKWGVHGVYLFWKIWRWWWGDELKEFYHIV